MFQNLYISHSKRGSEHFYLDASARYRCIFPCFKEIQDTTQHCIHIDQLDKIDLKAYQKIIFHRPIYSRKLLKTLKYLNSNGIQCIADFDDLLFSPEHALENPTYLSGNTSKKASRASFNNYLKALTLFKHVQVSTDRLKEHVERMHPQAEVSVIYNLVPDFWPKLTKLVPAEQRLENKVIRYFPGTTHHTSNFNNTIDFLKHYLTENKDVRLEVVGDIDIDSSIFTESQFKQYESNLFDELPELIASSWVTISPLENNEFNHCKSGLKFWESGIFGVPVISNCNLDMGRFKNDGLLLSDDYKEWSEFLEKLKDDGEYLSSSTVAQNVSKDAYMHNCEQDLGSNSILYSTYLSAHIGPNWLECLYNPASNMHNTAKLKFNYLNETKPKINNQELSNLKIEANILKLKYMNLGSINKLSRKVSKLKRTPILFFKDMLKKRALS